MDGSTPDFGPDVGVLVPWPPSFTLGGLEIAAFVLFVEEHRVDRVDPGIVQHVALSRPAEIAPGDRRFGGLSDEAE